MNAITANVNSGPKREHQRQFSIFRPGNMRASHSTLIRLAAFLAQRIGQAEPQLLGSLAADILTDLRSLLRNCRPPFDQLLSSRLTKESFHLAHFLDREIGSIDGCRLLEHFIVVRRINVVDLGGDEVLIAFELRSFLRHHGLDAEQDAGQELLVLLPELHSGYQAFRRHDCLG